MDVQLKSALQLARKEYECDKCSEVIEKRESYWFFYPVVNNERIDKEFRVCTKCISIK